MFKQLILMAALLVVTKDKVLAQTQNENLKIYWPAEYKWKIASNQNTAAAHMLEIIPGNETLKNWSLIGTMVCMKNVKTVPIANFVQTTYNKMKASAPKAKLVIIEDGTKAKNPYALFKIESPSFINQPTPESQLYYVIQGNQSLFNNFIAVRQPVLGPLFVEKWVRVFKGSKFVYQ